MPDVFLLTGSNRGERFELLQNAREQLEGVLGPCRASSIWQSEPWGFEDATPFLNQVLQFFTDESPEAILDLCLSTEEKLGRTRNETKGYAARTIDIDVLFYGQDVILTERLTVPHPLLHRRRFTLAPMNEIAPIFRHPMMHLSMQELLAACKDTNEVNKVEHEV